MLNLPSQGPARKGGGGGGGGGLKSSSVPSPLENGRFYTADV